MAIFNYFKAKEQGFTDAEIISKLAEDQAGFSYDKARQQGFSDMEIIGKLAYDIDPNSTNTLNAVGRGIERGITSTGRGLDNVRDSIRQTAEEYFPTITKNVTEALEAAPEYALLGGSRKEEKAKDIKDEFQYELMKSQGFNTAAMGGYALGTLTDPYNFIGGAPKTVAGFAKEGAIIGGITGFLDPQYTDEGNSLSSRYSSAMWSAGGGAALGTGIGKLLQKFGAIKSVDDVANDVTNIDDALKNTYKDVANQPESIVTPKTSPDSSSVVQDLDTAINKLNNGEVITIDPYNALLPDSLNKASPRFGADQLAFNSDLDRALYIVGNKTNLSAADQKYMDWIKSVTGISDENLIRSAGIQIKNNVKNTEGIDGLRSIAPSNLDTFVPITRAADSTISPTIPVAPFQQSLDINPPLNVASKAWQSLDNSSKIVYNIGRQLLEAQASNRPPKYNPKDPNILLAGKEIKTVFPDANDIEMGKILRAYAKTMEDLATVKGAEWTPPKFGTFMREGGIGRGDEIALAKAGFFDGCEFI